MARLVAAGSGLAGEEVAPHLLAEVSSLGSGTRVIGVYDQRYASDLGNRCVALWGVKDPGNVGTVLRAALAFGATSVALGPGSADPFGTEGRARVDGRGVLGAGAARARRSTSCRRRAWPWPRAPGWTSRTSTPPRRSWSARSAMACPPTCSRRATQVAHIPIAGESLNAAMAATVALYEME